MNGDGKPDLIVGDCCFGANQGAVSVLVGNGDGSFQPAKTFDTGGMEATEVALGDLNGDGKPDIVVSNTYMSNNIGVLLGNGDGTFQPVVTYPAGGSPYSVVIADVNADSKPDLVLAISESCLGCGALVAVLLGNGDGTFQPVVTYSSGGYSYQGDPVTAAVADLNGDGKLDIAVINTCSGNFQLFIGGRPSWHTAWQRRWNVPACRNIPGGPWQWGIFVGGHR